MCRVRGQVGQPGSADPTLVAILYDSTPEASAEFTPESTSEEEATAEATLEETAEATAEATAESGGALTPTLLVNGDGYLFLIQGNGQYAIMRSRGRSLTPLVDWRQSDRINQGAARNTMRAICAGDYLALYVNDTFLAEATDDAYQEGQIGLVASAANRLGAVIQFDNVTVSAPAPG
jgi:hypothetical protein